MRVRVGTSGYNYPEWKGSFYPADMKPARMLPYYAERFSTVEINATFYRMPTASTVAGWAKAVPEAFTFVLKAPQRITHFARLANVADTVRFFCDTARVLGARLGPLFFQLPPNFRKDAARLADLLALLPFDLRAAFECNVLGPLDLIQRVARVMQKQGGGLIIHVSSGAGQNESAKLPGRGGWGLGYSLTKAASNRMAAGLGKELRQHGIAILAVQRRLAVLPDHAAQIDQRALQLGVGQVHRHDMARIIHHAQQRRRAPDRRGALPDLLD